MLQEPLEEVAKRGPEAVRKKVERESVGESLRAFSTSVRALVAHASPDRCVPTFDDDNHHRLADVFCRAYAPQPDILGAPDYAALCRHAKHVARDIMALGSAAKPKNVGQVTRHLEALRPRWQAYVHHDNRWRAAVGPRHFTLDDRGTQLTEVARYATFNKRLLPDALVDTARIVSRVRGRDEHARLHDNLPDLLMAGMQWERDNFADGLKAMNGRMLRTERWLMRTPRRLGESLRSWQARAITALLLRSEALTRECPETLLLAEHALQKAKSALATLGLVAAGELRMRALLRLHGTSPSLEERLALQRKFMERSGATEMDGRGAACAVVLGVAAALRARGGVVFEEELTAAHGEGLVADFTDFTRAFPSACLARLGERLVRELTTPSLNDDPNETVTPALLRLQQLARDLQRLLEVDRQVSGDYYEKVSASRRTLPASAE